MDDVINVSGHRMGTAEVESALVLHDAVAEAAVVGFPHDIKGQGIYAYVTLMHDVEESDELRGKLSDLVRSEIGAIAKPDVIQWAPGLPKTRSGKIMRRILRKIAANEIEELGDTSTLANQAVIEYLIKNRELKFDGIKLQRRQRLATVRRHGQNRESHFDGIKFQRRQRFAPVSFGILLSQKPVDQYFHLR